MKNMTDAITLAILGYHNTQYSITLETSNGKKKMAWRSKIANCDNYFIVKCNQVYQELRNYKLHMTDVALNIPQRFER